MVVDNDINVHDPKEVLWALFTRCQPDKDSVFVNDLPGIPNMDSSLRDELIGSKLGLDATRPEGRPEKTFEMVSPPEDATSKAFEILRKYLEL